MKTNKYKAIFESCYKSLEEINVPPKYIETLQSEGIETLGDLILNGEKELAKIKKIGKKTIFDLNKILKKYGFIIRDD